LGGLRGGGRGGGDSRLNSCRGKSARSDRIIKREEESSLVPSADERGGRGTCFGGIIRSRKGKPSHVGKPLAILFLKWIEKGEVAISGRQGKVRQRSGDRVDSLHNMPVKVFG